MRKRLFLALALGTLVLGSILASTWSARDPEQKKPTQARPTAGVDGKHMETTPVSGLGTERLGSPDSLSTARQGIAAAAAAEARKRNQTVYVKVQDAPSSFGMPVAGVHVVVGIGRSSYGSPLWRATPPTNTTVLGSGISDTEGLARIAFHLPDAVDGSSKDGVPVLFARVEEPGLCRGQRLTPLSDVTVPEMRLQLVAHPGVSLTGRVLSSEEAPVDHGIVEVYREDESHRTGFDITGRAAVGLDGRFELDLPESGPWQVQARAENVGAVTLRDVSILETSTNQPLEIRLGGRGFLSGRILSPDEAPLPGLDLWAVPAERRDETDGSFSEVEHLAAGSTPGTLDGKTTTTEDGFFTFRGLKEKSYLLRTTARNSWDYDTLLTPDPVPTGTSGLLFHIDHPCLIVRLRNAQGDGVQAETDELPQYRSPMPLSLYIFRVDGMGLPLTPTREIWGRRTFLGEGAYGFDVGQGVDYLVGAFSSHHRPTERRVALNTGSSTREVVLDLPPEELSGILEIEVQTPDGHAVQGRSQVQVRSSGGAALFDDGFRDEGPEHRIELPPGTYELLVSAPAERGLHGTRFGKAKYGSRRLSVTVAPGATTELPIRLLRGGRVRFLVQLDGPPGKTSDPAGSTASSYLQEKLHGITPRFLPADGGPALSALFAQRVEGRPVSLPPEDETEWFAPGTPGTTLDPLPAGEYRVRLSCEGYRSLLVPVTILPDETVDVTATLEPAE